MKSLRNSVNLVGRLGADPEFKTINGGTSVAKFSVATNESYKDGNGEKQEQTQWHNIIAWGKLAETVSKYLKKGSEVMLEGRLVYNNFESENGEKKYFTEISMNEMLMLGTK